MRVLALALAAGTVAAAPSMEQAGACVKACDEGDCNGLVKKFQAPCHDCIVACGDELPPMSEVIDDAKEWTADQWEAVETDKLDEFLEEAKKKGPEFWKELTADMDWKTAATWEPTCKSRCQCQLQDCWTTGRCSTWYILGAMYEWSLGVHQCSNHLSF